MIRLRPSGADEVLIKRVRDWYEPGPGVFIAPQALFNPALLFTTGVNGTWYDPSDLNTLFQDAAGTTPVTAVEQPVGLMLDKSKGLVLGPELVTNGTFDSGTTNWTAVGATQAVVGGEFEITVTASGWRSFQEFTTVVGRAYVVTGSVRPAAGNSVAQSGRVTIASPSYSVAADANGATKQVRFVFVATSTTSRVELGVASGGAVGATGDKAFFDNISVRELPGNHAFNSSGNSANFPVLSARYNLLERTEDFTNAYWSKNAAVTVTQSGVIGTISVPNTIGAGVNIFFKQSISTVINTTSRIEVRGPVGVSIALADDFGTTTAAFTGDWQTITLNTTGNGGFHQFYLRTVTANQAYSFEVRYPDFRVSNDALNQPAYQRVNTATDYDTVGFKPYLKFNGTNQWLQTNSIDFSYGDKMFVCAGVRKLSDAATGILSELSATTDGNNGAFFLLAPSQGATASYRTRSKGTASVDLEIISGYPAPITNVLSFTGNISAPSTTIRVNGSQVTQSTITQGTGNYGNYPLYIGARAGTSLWFNGRLHQLVVAGKQASASEIGQTEAFVNQKTGAY